MIDVIEQLTKENKALHNQLQEELEKRQLGESKNKELEAALSHHKDQYEWLMEKFLELQRQRFGSKSERYEPIVGQLPLIEDQQDDQEENEKPQKEKITYTRKKGKRDPINYEGIPKREEIIQVENKTCSCGRERVVIDYEEKQMLHHIPAKFELLIQKREVLACCHCDQGVETAPSPLHILPRCKATESLLAHIAVSKVLDRQPLYHLEKRFEREYGWFIPRSTMARWMIQLSIPLQALVNRMKDKISEYDIASADATRIQVLNEPDKKAESKSTAYCIRGGPPGQNVVLFEYLDIAHKAFLENMFCDFKGVLMVDGDNDFDFLPEKYPIILSKCHAHARRKFEAIWKIHRHKAKLAKYAMDTYSKIYHIERTAKDESMSADELRKYRQEEAQPIFQEFKKWLDQHLNLVPPKSPIGKAISYTINHWSGLMTYLSDGRLDPDNNATERQIKYFVMARKNFLFCESQPGADALGTLFSILLTAKQHNLCPRTYLEAVLKRFPHCQSFDDIDQLLPWNLKHHLGP